MVCLYCVYVADCISIVYTRVMANLVEPGTVLIMLEANSLPWFCCGEHDHLVLPSLDFSGPSLDGGCGPVFQTDRGKAKEDSSSKSSSPEEN